MVLELLEQASDKCYCPGFAPSICSPNSNYLLPPYRNDPHLLGGGFPGRGDLSRALLILLLLSSYKNDLYLLGGRFPGVGDLSLPLPILPVKP